MFHGFEFAVMGKIDRSERSTRRSTYRKSWESRFDDAEFLRNSRGRKSRNSRGHPSLGPRLCNDYLVFTSLLDPADRIWRMDNLIPTSNDESTSLDCVDQKLESILVLFLRLLFRKKKWMECCANLLYAIFWKWEYYVRVVLRKIFCEWKISIDLDLKNFSIYFLWMVDQNLRYYQFR